MCSEPIQNCIQSWVTMCGFATSEKFELFVLGLFLPITEGKTQISSKYQLKM